MRPTSVFINPTEFLVVAAGTFNLDQLYGFHRVGAQAMRPYPMESIGLTPESLENCF